MEGRSREGSSLYVGSTTDACLQVPAETGTVATENMRSQMRLFAVELWIADTRTEALASNL